MSKFIKVSRITVGQVVYINVDQITAITINQFGDATIHCVDAYYVVKEKVEDILKLINE